MTEEPRSNAERRTLPQSSAFRDYIHSQWADRDETLPPARDQAAFAAARRVALGAKFPGQRIIVCAGQATTRSNDTQYMFRADSDFSYLTGWGSDSEPGSVLVLEPVTVANSSAKQKVQPAESAPTHTATLYFRERADRTHEEFYANPQIGEFWIGPRPSTAFVAADLNLATKDLSALATDIAADVATDIASLEASEIKSHPAGVAQVLAEMRLVKDSYEIDQIRQAVASSIRGFSDIARVLPKIAGQKRGERLVEAAFASRARLEGNTTGYDTIAASGAHACILHWIRNDGTVNADELILIDAGVELDSYYTADLTRTLPVSGTFSAAQRKVYEAVLAAADAAFAVVKPGITFRDIHAAAMKVIAEKTAEWGLLPVSAEQALLADQQQHRRYMVHGTSHHLGLDVHDCAQARREMYMDGIVTEGMVFTIEPGLYFQPDDLTVPEELRGIGVRIEDNVLVTANGCENLSADLPRQTADVERWIRG